MSIKIKLGITPKAFAPVAVTFPLPDGTQGSIECTFRYRTRRQFGELIARSFGDNAAEMASGSGDTPDIAKAVAHSVHKSGAYLTEVIVGWNLDLPVDLSNATQLADELPAAASAIVQAYARAVTEGHLGN